MEQSGEAAWTIEETTAQSWFTGEGQTLGETSDQSAFWIKPFCWLGTMFTLTKLAEQHQIAKGKVMIVCNSYISTMPSTIDDMHQP